MKTNEKFELFTLVQLHLYFVITKKIRQYEVNITPISRYRCNAFLSAIDATTSQECFSCASLRYYKVMLILHKNIIGRVFAFHVPVQLNRLFAEVFAFLASKWFLTSVGKSVIFQTVLISARVTALIADKGLFFSMLPHVCLEMTSVVG